MLSEGSRNSLENPSIFKDTWQEFVGSECCRRAWVSSRRECPGDGGSFVALMDVGCGKKTVTENSRGFQEGWVLFHLKVVFSIKGETHYRSEEKTPDNEFSASL